MTLIGRAFPEHVAWSSAMMIADLMRDAGAGSFVFGLLRSIFSVEALYQFSTLYPVIALVATVIVVRSVPRKQTVHELWTGSQCQ